MLLGSRKFLEELGHWSVTWKCVSYPILCSLLPWTQQLPSALGFGHDVSALKHTWLKLLKLWSQITLFSLNWYVKYLVPVIKCQYNLSLGIRKLDFKPHLSFLWCNFRWIFQWLSTYFLNSTVHTYVISLTWNDGRHTIAFPNITSLPHSHMCLYLSSLSTTRNSSRRVASHSESFLLFLFRNNFVIFYYLRNGGWR